MNPPESDLNLEQKKAVTFTDGPLLIIAGAGTGKTKVIAHRIANLIATKRARPEQIMAVTFTEKAANEMEERVDVLIPYSYSFVEISTFNSFGEKILRNYGHELGYAVDINLLDEVEQAIFFRERLFEFPLDYYRPLSSPARFIQELLGIIKKLKQENISPEEYQSYANKLLKKAKDKVKEEEASKHLEIAQVYAKYQDLLKQEGKIDFEDQVLIVVELFNKRPSILQEFQEKYKYILVDEFQDTNYIQFELLKKMAEKHKNITVVGDDDQSIFRFRGASLSNILKFRDVYPHYKKIVLNKNYRSTQPILDASYQLIKHNNPDRLEVKEAINKKLESQVESDGKSIHMYQFDTLSHEADRVAEIILEKVEEGFKYKDFAILVRRNTDADPFLQSLNMKEIPFRFSGSRGLYTQDEIKILVSFIKALTDFEDSKSLFYLSLSEVYRVDAYDLSIISNFAYKKHIPLHKIFRMIHEGKSPVEISQASREKVVRIFRDLLYFVQLASSKNAGQVLFSFLEKSGYLKSLVREGGLPEEIKTKNIRMFFDKVKHYSELSENDSLYSFSQHLDLLQQVGDNPASAEADLDEDAVNVLTVHKAKGLEYPIVFMVSLIADRFPGRERREKIPVPDDLIHENLPSAGNPIQEERRLFYVGMTRAKKKLYLSWARDYGLKRLKHVSPFVLEALDLVKAPDETLRSSALEEIKRYAPRESSPVKISGVKENGVISLSYFRLDDYLTCPLRYKFRHIMRIPVLPHHNLVFGRTLHAVIDYFLLNKISGNNISENDFFKEYERRWINEGFLSREHEDMRKKEGKRALCFFYQRERIRSSVPFHIEKDFHWFLKDMRFSGRWDRIDVSEDGAIITDFKASRVKDQNEADKKTRDSLQMDLYALSFSKIREEPLLEVRLHFLESDIIGHAQKTESDLKKAMDKIEDAKDGIRSLDFNAKPDWHNCNYCDFKSICPDSYAF
ncbi:ATP-dependent helicase [Acidobacteriota bacterium]